MVRQSLFAAIAGAVIAVVALAIDAALPQLPGVPVENLRSLLAGLLGSLITVAAVLFWVRATFVQLAATQFSPRVVQGHLSDRHEQQALAFLLGAFSAALVLLLGLPAGGQSPTLAVGLAAVIGIAAFLTVVQTVVLGLRMSRPSYLVLSLARHAVALIREQLVAAESEAPRQTAADDGVYADCVSVASDHAGWLTALDEEVLVEAVAAQGGGTLLLDVRPGMLLTPGRRLARVAPPAAAAAVQEASGDALRFADERPADDLDLTLRELVDVAVQAMAPHSADAARGYEAIEALGWVLAELLSRDLPTPRRRDDGVLLMRASEPSHAQRLQAVLDPLARSVQGWPLPSRSLSEMVGDVAERLDRAALDHRAALLREVARDTGIA